MAKEKIKIRSGFQDISNFIKIPSTRKGIIDSAPDTPLKHNYAVNAVADFLHPSVQYLKIDDVEQLAPNVRRFTLVPDAAHGTAKLAYFRPGQYLSFKLDIDGHTVSRPFSICSSANDSLDDKYTVTVKREPDGFASKYIFEQWAKGVELTASAPSGTFYHQPIRDSKHIVAIAGGIGITPFLSMAHSIADGSMDADLTILYGCRKKNEAFFMNELSEITESTDRVKVVYIFSDERVDKCERGFITKSIIEKYAPQKTFSVFVCGPSTLYAFASSQLLQLGIERKLVRFELGGELRDVTGLSDFPEAAAGKTFLIKVIRNGELLATVPCASDETLLSALEKEGITPLSLCRSGECGFCRSKLTAGNVFIPRSGDYRRTADAGYGIVHPCCSYPMSDLTLVIN